MLLLLIPQGGAASGLDLSEVIRDLLPALNARSFADLVFWTETDLFAFADEAAKRMARNFGTFIERDATLTISIGQAVYPLPARHVVTLHATVATRALRPVTIPELEAGSDTWPADTASVPTRFSQHGEEHIRVWPAPTTAAGVLALVLGRFPAPIAPASPFVQAPLCLREWWTFHVLAAARGQKSQGAMPEVARYFRGMADMLEQVIAQYWGQI